MISDSEYIFSGRLEIDYINGKYGLELPINEDYQTLACLVLFEFQGIPAESDEIQAGEYTIKVIKASQNKIELLKNKYKKLQSQRFKFNNINIKCFNFICIKLNHILIPLVTIIAYKNQ